MHLHSLIRVFVICTLDDVIVDKVATNQITLFFTSQSLWLSRLILVIEYTRGVIPISLFLLATGAVLCKAAIDRGVRLSTGLYGCRYRAIIYIICLLCFFNQVRMA